MNTEEEIRTLKEEISKKLDEVSELKNKIKNLQVGGLIKFLKGKYFKSSVMTIHHWIWRVSTYMYLKIFQILGLAKDPL